MSPRRAGFTTKSTKGTKGTKIGVRRIAIFGALPDFDSDLDYDFDYDFDYDYDNDNDNQIYSLSTLSYEL